MSLNYFGAKNIGGAYLSAGINYQDMVSLLYLFKFIQHKEFKEVTLETIDDFTILFTDYEICVQVKKNRVTRKLIKTIYNTKNFTTNSKRKYIIVSTGLEDKIKEIYSKIEHYKNVVESSVTNIAKDNVKMELESIVKKAGLDLEKLLFIDFAVYDENTIEEYIKYNMYEYSKSSLIKFDVDILFDKIISIISKSKRKSRGHLSKEEVYKLASESPVNYTNLTIRNYYKEFSKDSMVRNIEILIYNHNKFSLDLKKLKYSIEKGDLDNALELINELKKYIKEVHYLHLWILFSLNKMDLLEVELNQLDEDNYLLLYYKAHVSINKGNLDSAIKELLTALEGNNSYDINNLLGDIYLKLNKKNEALMYYEKCLDIDSLDTDLYLKLSNLVATDKAIQYIDEGLIIDKDSTNLHFRKGELLLEQSKYEDAYNYLTKNILYNHENFELNRLIGFCLLYMNDSRAYNYLNLWIINTYISNEAINIGEKSLIIHMAWENTLVITVDRVIDGLNIKINDYEYKLNDDRIDGINIGVITDFFLSMSAKMFGKQNDPSFSVIPCVISKHNKDTFDKFENHIMKLYPRSNKDYYDNDETHYRQYIVNDESIDIKIDEYMDKIVLVINVSGLFVRGNFNKSGQGSYLFTSKLDEYSIKGGYNELSIMFSCKELKEVIDIRISSSKIKREKKYEYLLN